MAFAASGSFNSPCTIILELYPSQPSPTNSGEEAENLSFAGHDDWRLPNVRELQSIVYYGRWGKSIDPVFGALSSSYWSSTSYAVFPNYAWFVYLFDGNVDRADKVSSNHVRAVRSGP